uniref:Reverse transcriptase domain-containing protein n=1 Tax=Cannabis sativa TaxID=3483 RepID=A0A803Q5Y6_CANSA
MGCSENDMEKVFDRVEWSFVEAILKHVGFPSRFVSLVLRCVSTVSFKFLVNGCLSEGFNSTRGIRQGDPLSPYLFLLVVEGLSAAIRVKESTREFSSLVICRNAPVISHLFR